MFNLVDVEYGKDMRIVDRGLQYVMIVGDVRGVICHGQAFYFSKLGDNITLTSIVLYVATIWDIAKITKE